MFADKHGDSNPHTNQVRKNIAAFFAAPFASCPGVSFQIKVVNQVEVFGDMLAYAVPSDTLKKSVIADEADYSSITQTIRSPPESLDLGIAQTVFESCF